MTSELREFSTCEVCGSSQLLPVLNLGGHPMCDDLVKVGDARICREYPIEILYCETCRTGHQRFQVPKQLLFPATYHYRARFTKDVLTGMASLVESCERVYGNLAGKRVLDIGCNDGSLLSFFREKGAITLGIEPTGAAEDARAQGHTVWNGFLSQSVAGEVVATHGPVDIITFTNVFAHIEDLPDVLASVRRLMGPHTAIVIENHYLGSILDTSQFDTFYHEHPRTYSYSSFLRIAQLLGVPLSGVEFPSRYGGNIRVYLGGAVQSAAASLDEPALLRREELFLDRFAAMRTNIERWRSSRRAQIAELVGQHGPLLAKAFPGRAAILIKLLGLDTESIAAVHEQPGSPKIGHYLPGTRVPIVSDDNLFAMPDKSKPILNLAWHIPNEIRSYLTQSGWTGPVVDIVSAGDLEP